MKLLEYEAKDILQASGIPIPKSFTAGDTPEFLPVVIKSQVPTGGRGKAGGIAIVKTVTEYIGAREKVQKLAIKGYVPKTLLAEEVLEINQELYLSLLIDKSAATIIVMASPHGGIEVEDQHDFKTWELKDDWSTDTIGQALADYYNLSEKTFALQDLVEKLHRCFTTNDATLLEINPLVLTKQGNIVAGDCKMELDDAATFRHPEWKFEAEKSDVNFVTLNQDGEVATIANGAGLAMATVDAVADAGLTPANFLDIGGGANEASVLAAFERLIEYPQLRVIIINIFAGITRCDEVAKAIVAAREKLPHLPPLAVRLTGTNYEQAVEILGEQGVAIESSLANAIVVAKEKIS